MTIQELRVSVLAAVLEACREHGLPAPMNVYITDYAVKHIDLRMDSEHPEHVDAWAEFLSLPTASDELFDDELPWVSHKSRSHNFDEGAWLGAEMVEVWCSVRGEAAVAAARAEA